MVKNPPANAGDKKKERKIVKHYVALFWDFTAGGIWDSRRIRERLRKNHMTRINSPVSTCNLLLHPSFNSRSHNQRSKPLRRWPLEENRASTAEAQQSASTVHQVTKSLPGQEKEAQLSTGALSWSR